MDTYNRSKPKNIIENEYRIDLKCEELLQSLPSFVYEYYKYLSVQGKSRKTKLAYIFDLMHFFDYLSCEVTLDVINTLTAKDINDYLTYCTQYENDGVVYQNSKVSRARKKSSISGLLNFLYRNDLIENDITSKIAPISIKSSERIVKCLQEPEIFDLMEVLETGEGLSSRQQKSWQKTKYRDKLMIILLVVYGLRISELQQLNVSSFNFKRNEFIIYRKRSKEAVMPINNTLKDAYREYIDKERPNIDNDALLLSLPTKTGTRERLSERQIRDIVKKYTSLVIGGNGYSPHKLRATAATTAIRRGNDIFRVANLLDHDSVTTTQKYLQKNIQDKKDVLDSLEL